MKSVRFILIISLMVFALILLPTYSLEVFGKKVIGPRTTPKVGDGKVKTPKDLESLRSSFKKGVEALNNGNALIAGLLLGGLEEGYPVLGDYVLYHRMRAAIEIGHFPLARSLADRFLKDYPESVLYPRVQMEMVKAFYLLEQFSSAMTVAENLLDRELDPEMKRQLSLMLGEAYEGEEEWKGAVEVYQRLAFEEPSTLEGEEAERRITRIADKTGIQPVIPADSLFLTRVKALNKSLMFDRVIESCDSFQEVYPVGQSLDKALLLKARALLKKGRIEEGKKLYARLSRSAGAGAIQAEAAYSLASHYWNTHGNSKAKKEFKRLIKKFPRSEWGIKARYALGRIYEAEKSISKAREYYLSVGKINPENPLAAKGAWRAGWVEYKAGKFEKAVKSFNFCMKRYSKSDFFIGALYWKGRCKERIKHAEEAKTIFRGLAQNYSWTFYGVMARKRMESSWSLVPDTNETGEEEKAWEPEPIHAEPGTPLAYHLDRADELIRIGFFKESKEEIDALQALKLTEKGDGLCYVGTLYKRSRSFYDSVLWMYTASLRGCSDDLKKDSIYYKRFLYPLAYWETVRKETEEIGLDPFLVLAVMRQESLFRPDIVSPADARGLMQIIPPTGEMIARKLKVPDFDPEDLFETEKNIAFGAWYLHNLMRRSEGDLVRLFSSYNAGESRSREWWERFNHLDVDERIESITFRETRGYVKKVLRNLENYKRIYEKSSFAHYE